MSDSDDDVPLGQRPAAAAPQISKDSTKSAQKPTTQPAQVAPRARKPSIVDDSDDDDGPPVQKSGAAHVMDHGPHVMSASASWRSSYSLLLHVPAFKHGAKMCAAALAGCSHRIHAACQHMCASAAAAAKPKPKAPAAERKPASEAKAPKSEAERALLKNESIVKREVEQEQRAEEQKAAHKQQTKAAAAKMYHNDLVNIYIAAWPPYGSISR
jgi:hypothetical protein